jgi:predicted Zn-dependent protease
MAASDAPKSPASNTLEGATSTTATVPPAGKETTKSEKYDVDRIGQRNIGHGVNLYSLQKERALGESMAAAIDRNTKFVTDPEINGYVSRLGQKIARHSDAELPFTIKVIDCPDRRIFGLPGGFLYVDKGLITEVDSESELAALMAHEIAHVAARHATRFATRKYAWNMLSVPLAYISGPAAIGTHQLGPLGLMKFSRDAELEADLLGIEYQYAAGYDPQVFVEALEKLSKKEMEDRARAAKGQSKSFKPASPGKIARAFSNYPPTEERIEKAQTAISTFLPDRNDYVLDTSEFQEVRARLAQADRPVLHRQRPGDAPVAGPVLRRSPDQDSQTPSLAGQPAAVTKGRLSSVFSHLPALSQ